MLVLAGSLLAQLVSATTLPPAWQITDNSTNPGTTPHYIINLTPEQRTAATNLTGGFNYFVYSRLVDGFSSTNETMTMIYSVGSKRFLVWWRLDSNSNLTARLEAGATYTLTTNGAGTAMYHLHQFVYNPTNGTVSYWVDDQRGAIMTMTVGWTS